MSETDPHIHVEQKVMQAGADYRNLIASSLGHAPDAPDVVTVGCGLPVPYAMTSTRPESVTCLACREHAHREYLRYAEQVERLSRMPGAPVTGDQAARAARWARDFAKRFSG
ncbi:hypothetical protein [Microbispora bryophytorum]|uniref:Uncharacterized protein n=1 Tax=Microbispora bryophytorum TaxID=1460882 RepID=A0A8H9LA20_9ACTN|nr:hypothetical protein [Microbispora bryophytorum]MBD3136105.1 hypothetical protein [Microbispora bryophytorum]TQS07854.1 hypothetical protein FLX07_08565 [Microbispora bryophytorum]GGO04482.1 hypothetical protein GCM10011574_15450 [Microbispora bryophytorum]